MHLTKSSIIINTQSLSHIYTHTGWTEPAYLEKTTNSQPCKQVSYLESGMSEPRHKPMTLNSFMVTLEPLCNQPMKLNVTYISKQAIFVNRKKRVQGIQWRLQKTRKLEQQPVTSSPMRVINSSTERGFGLQVFFLRPRWGLYCGMPSSSTLVSRNPPTLPRIAPRPWPPGVVAIMWIMSPF